jgi:hypothetical protein
MRRLPALATALATAVAVMVAVPAGAHAASGAVSAHGQTLVSLNANQSTNWFGYNQGALEKGNVLFHGITGDWNVPTATQHTKGADEFSSTWIGIGGGCVDAGCAVGDNTLIQTGTEQDFSSGSAQYSAWWEVIPGPSIGISMTVAPGDHMHADIHETITNSEVWSITLTDVTRNETFTQTVPYSSSYATAEWIEETPLIIGTNAGFAALPNLTNSVFDLGTVNLGSGNVNPNLVAGEEMQLVNATTGRVYATPSGPDSDKDGFAACAWATSCATPAS